MDDAIVIVLNALTLISVLMLVSLGLAHHLWADERVQSGPRRVRDHRRIHPLRDTEPGRRLLAGPRACTRHRWPRRHDPRTQHRALPLHAPGGYHPRHLGHQPSAAARAGANLRPRPQTDHPARRRHRRAARHRLPAIPADPDRPCSRHHGRRFCCCSASHRSGWTCARSSRTATSRPRTASTRAASTPPPSPWAPRSPPPQARSSPLW